MKNRGFSLITLCITIVVIIILSTITIFAVNSSGILGKREEIEFKNNMKNYDIEIKSNTFSELKDFSNVAIYKKEDVKKYSISLANSDYLTDDFETTIAYIYQGVLTLRGKNITMTQRKWAREARIKIDDEGIIPQNKVIDIITSTAGCTNQGVVLNFYYNGVIPEGYKIQYKIGNDEWKYGDTALISQNNIVYARLYNSITQIEGIAVSSIDIANIDSFPPTSPSIKVLDIKDGKVTYKAYGATDDDGIECVCSDSSVCDDLNNCSSNNVGYQYSNNSYTWSSTLKEGKEYTIDTNNDDIVYMYARAIDCSKNLSDSSYLNLYKIKYDVNGGNIANKPDDTYKIQGENYIIASEIQEKTGYTFTGWEDTKDNKLYKSGDNFANDYTTTLTAKWTPATVAMTFMRNINQSDTESFTKTFTYGVNNQSMGNDKNWTRAGYDLVGWSRNKNATTPAFTVNNGISNNWIDKNQGELTVYGVWQEATYTVTLDGNGGVPPTANTSKVTYNGTYGSFLDNAATRLGYTFVGWYTEKTGGVRVTSNTKVEITSDTTLYAHWNKKWVKVTFMRNINQSDTESFTKTFYAGDGTAKMTNDKNWTNPGYILAYWSRTQSGSKAYNIGNGISDKWIDSNAGKTIIAYGIWEPITYTITYDGNGATSGSTQSSIHTYDVAKNLTANGYTKTGYTFNGWNTNANGTGTSYSDLQSVINLENVSESTVKLYAIWKPKWVKVKFMRNINSSDTESFTKTFYAGDGTAKMTNDKNWTNPGYILVYWSRTQSGSKAYDIGNGISDKWIDSNAGTTITAYGIWLPQNAGDITFTNGTYLSTSTNQTEGSKTVTTHAYLPAGVTITCTAGSGGYTGNGGGQGGGATSVITFNNTDVDRLDNGILTYTTTSDGIVKISITASGNGGGGVTINSITNSYGQTYTLKSLTTSYETWSNVTKLSVSASAGQTVEKESIINVPNGITITCIASGGGSNRWWWRNDRI